MNIKLLMLTHNRANYTRISLGGLLSSLPDYASVVVWDNASDNETKSVVREFENHPRLEHIEFSEQNLKLREPTNWFWDRTKGSDFISKVDDDCLLKKGWCEQLLDSHKAFPESGIIGTWLFYPEDTDCALLEKKVVEKNGQKLFSNCWVQGSGYLMRRTVVEKLGHIRPKESFTYYCIRAAKKGFLNGFAFPFIFEDHFDDPRSEYSEIKTDADLQRYMPLSAKKFGATTIVDWLAHNKKQAVILQNASRNPSNYMGLRANLRKVLRKIGLK